MPEVHWQTCKNSNTLRAEVRPQLQSSYLEVVFWVPRACRPRLISFGTVPPQVFRWWCGLVMTHKSCVHETLWSNTGAVGLTRNKLRVRKVSLSASRPKGATLQLTSTLGSRGSDVWHGSSSDNQKCACTRRPARAVSYTRWAVTSQEGALIWHHGNWTFGTRWLMQVIQWWWISAFGPGLRVGACKRKTHTSPVRLLFLYFNHISFGSVY